MKKRPYRCIYQRFVTILTLVIVCCVKTATAEQTYVPFGGPKMVWHGFDRYDFLLDEQTLAVKAFTAMADEHNGIKEDVNGQRRCGVIVPKVAGAVVIVLGK